MVKYEVMLVVSGNIELKNVKQITRDVQEIFAGFNNLKEEYMGLLQIAYKMRKNTHAHYYVYRFETADKAAISELNRRCMLKPDVYLRLLVINLEKDYGYRESVNPVKLKRAEFKHKLYEEKLALKRAEHERLKEAGITSHFPNRRYGNHPFRDYSQLYNKKHHASPTEKIVAEAKVDVPDATAEKE